MYILVILIGVVPSLLTTRAGWTWYTVLSLTAMSFPAWENLPVEEYTAVSVLGRSMARAV
jgi:hypothetical protein